VIWVGQDWGAQLHRAISPRCRRLTSKLYYLAGRSGSHPIEGNGSPYGAGYRCLLSPSNAREIGFLAAYMKRNLKYAIGISSSVIFLLLKTSNYVQLWRGDSSAVAIATFAVCFLLFLVAAGYVAYSTVESKIVGVSKSPRYPRLHKTAALVLWGFPTALVMVSLALLVFQEPQKKPGELIILVAQFQGPHPETYRVTEHFLTALETSVGASDSITIRIVADHYTAGSI